MAIDPRKIINSPFGLKFARFLGKYVPYEQGHRIALSIADFISSHRSWKLVHIVRCNQWIVTGCTRDNGELDCLVKENFHNIAYSVYDFYHTLDNPTAALRLVEPHPRAIQLVQRPEFADRGLIIAGIHMSNFDIAFRLGGSADVKAISLTAPENGPAYQKQYEMRRESGLNVFPTSFSSIKLAIGHLRKGGLVMTAFDWPYQSSPFRPKFFGFPAALPIHHIFMALKAKVPIMVAGVHRKSDGKYNFFFSDPIEMEPHPDRDQETLLNAENLLHVAEGFIRSNPSQWSMSFPVWPDMLDKVPQ